MTHQEFLCGWYAAEQHDYIGNGKQTAFASYRTPEFIEGYNAFWDKLEEELCSAECDCIAEYDARVRAR